MATDLTTKRRNPRNYALAIVGVALLGGLYLWANTGAVGGPGDQRDRGKAPLPGEVGSTAR